MGRRRKVDSRTDGRRTRKVDQSGYHALEARILDTALPVH